MNARLLYLLLLFIGWPSTSTADPAVSDPLLDRYVAWRGGDAFLSVDTVFEEGQTPALGAQADFRRWTTSHGTDRRELDYGPLKQILVTGPTPWQQLNGRLASYDADDAAHDASAARLRLGSTFAPDAVDVVVSRGKDRTLGASKTAVLDIRFTTCLCEFELLIDPHSGELRAIHDPSQGKTSVYSEWRWINGVRMPVVWRDFDSSGKDIGTTRIETVDPGAYLSQSLVNPPKLPPQTSLVSERPGQVDMTMVRGTRPYLSARLNGRPVQALLDSGAAWTVLSQKFAQEIGLETFGSRPTLGTGGVATATYAAGVSLEVGNVRLDDLLVLVLDMDELETRLGISLSVIIGKQVFDEFVVDLDFAESRVGFHLPELFQPPAGATPLKFIELEGHRAIDIEVDGAPPAPFVFDTGNGSFPLMVYASFAERHGIGAGGVGATTMGGAIGGSRPIGITSVASLKVGGKEFVDVPAGLPPDDGSTASSSHYAGNLGMEVISRFRVITNHAQDQLWLIPGAGEVDKPFVKDRAGLSVVPVAAGIRVTHVSPNSPAQQAGLLSGHVITQIDGEPAIDVHRRDARWGSQASGTGIRLQVETIGQVDLRLADYF